MMKIYLRTIFLMILIFFPNSKSAEASKKTYKKEINIFFNNEPKTLDPSKSSDIASGELLTNSLEGLTRILKTPTGEEVPEKAGAASWKIEENGKKWTFFLRDYNWEDGKKVTAQDFEYGIKRSLNPKTASPMSYLLYPIKNGEKYNSGKVSSEEVGVKAIDDKTLVIELENPVPYFLQISSLVLMSPQRKDIVEKYGSSYGSSYNKMIFNGPFKVTEWNHEKKIVLSKNENYWDKSSVKLSKINIYILKDENSRMAMLFKGQVDIAEASKKEWADKFIKSGNFNEISGYSGATNFLFFNQKSELFKNEKVRRAFSMAINRKDMAEVIYRGIFEAAYGWIPPKVSIGEYEYRKKRGNILEENTTEARSLLIEGLKELGINKSPEEITVTFSNPNTSTWARKYSEYLAHMYKETLGINVKSQFLQWPIFEKNTADMNYEFAGMGWFGDYNDPSSFLETFMGNQSIISTGWKNDEYDKLLKKATITLDNEKRYQYFKRAEEILIKDSVIAPTVYIKSRIFYKKEIQGLMAPAFGCTNYKNVFIEK
jgi:ABC-type oligopeptide transport system substrate-binding subunit